MTNARMTPPLHPVTWSLLLAGCLLGAWTPVVQAVPTYSVQLVRREHDDVTVASDTKTTPPASISGSSSTNDGINAFYLTGYNARSDRLTLGLQAAAVTFSQYVVGRDWWEIAGWRWDDVVFTCQDGRSQVDASLRIKVKGFAADFSYTYTTARSGSVSLYLGHPQYLYTQGIWRAASNNAPPDNSCLPSPPYTCSPTSPGPASTGVFAGSTGDVLDQTVNFLMGEVPSPMVATGTPVVVAPMFTLALSTINERISGDFFSGGNGISLPTDGPVFNLPAGCSCNSEQIGIIDNRIAYRITAIAGAGGAVSPGGTVVVNHGEDRTFTIAPDGCNTIADVIVDGASVGAVSSYVFSNVTAAHTIEARFAVTPPSTIAASSGSGGAISPSGPVSVACAGSQSFTLTPAVCYHVADVLVDGASVGAVTSYAFSNVTAGHTIAASFALDGFTITASAGLGGNIAPSGSIAGDCGSDRGFSITPAAGYSIADVLVDGVSIGAVGSYAFTDIRAHHTIAASFTSAATPLAVSISAPASGAIFPVNTTVSFQGSFTGDLPGSTHQATWTLGGLTVPGTVNEGARTVNAAHAFTTPGVYMVQLTVNSSSGASATTSEVGGLVAMVVIYDPTGGFVTGGGWINSPPGAYASDPAMTGKASFGFESKYRSGATTPTGQTTFQFKAAGLSFSSESYEWLVVAGAKAMYKGVGRINGSGSYGFLLSAIDGALQAAGTSDRFRIKIWDPANGDAIAYDNQMGAPDTASATTTLGGGSIVIHRGGNGAGPAAGEQTREETPRLEFALRMLRPNPFTDAARAQFDLPEEAAVRVAVFDLKGRRVAQPVDGIFSPGSHDVVWDGRDSDGRVTGPGIYFVRMEARLVDAGRTQTATVKVMRVR